jgi:anti-sigma B factor antagonist
MDEPPLQAEVTHLDGSAVVSVAGELDVVTAPVLCQVIGGIVTPHLRAVTLDLSTLTFVDVIGLHALVDVGKMAVAAGAEFRLSGVTARTLRVIRLARFDELADVVTQA